MLLSEISILDKGEVTKNGQWSSHVNNFNFLAKDNSKLLGYIGKNKVISVNGSFTELYVAVVSAQNNKPLVIVEFTINSTRRAKMVDFVVSSPGYQGSGLATYLYAWLIKTQNWILQSGDEQSPGGMSIWKKLYQMPGIDVYAWDIRKHQAIQIDLDDFEYGNEIYPALDDADEYTDEQQKLIDSLPLLRKKHNAINQQIQKLRDSRGMFDARSKEELDLIKLSAKLYDKIDDIKKITGDDINSLFADKSTKNNNRVLVATKK